MARHTTCTTVENVWDGVSVAGTILGVFGAISFVVAAITAALVALGWAALTPQSMLVAGVALLVACISALVVLSRVLDYFMDYRLICLGEDRCALAQVITIEDNGDGDKSMNTILAPATTDTTEVDYQAMFQPAALVYVDPGVSSRGWLHDPKTKKLRSETFGRGLPFFHCEIEGTRLSDYLSALIAYIWGLMALATLAIATAAAAIASGPIAWVIWIAIAILAILIFEYILPLFGVEDVGSIDPGPLGDATPSPTGPIITDTGGDSVNMGEYIALLGRPVCDTGHNPSCWDELHPVKAVTKIEESEYNAAPATHTPGDIYDQYCAALTDFVDHVGTVEQGQTATDDVGNPILTCLEHPAVG